MAEMHPWTAMLIWLGQSAADLGYIIALPLSLIAGL